MQVNKGRKLFAVCYCYGGVIPDFCSDNNSVLEGLDLCKMKSDCGEDECILSNKKRTPPLYQGRCPLLLDIIVLENNIYVVS